MCDLKTGDYVLRCNRPECYVYLYTNKDGRIITCRKSNWLDDTDDFPDRYISDPQDIRPAPKKELYVKSQKDILLDLAERGFSYIGTCWYLKGSNGWINLMWSLCGKKLSETSGNYSFDKEWLEER